MSDVNTFSQEEIDAINDAKKQLQSHLNATKALEVREYLVAEKAFRPVNLIPENMNKLVVAGGCIPSFILKEMVHDIDIFILDMNISLFEDLVALKTGPWVVKWFMDPNEDDRSDDYKNEHIFATATNKRTKIQYILTDYTSRKELLDHFDFLHATASYHNGKLYINRETFDSIMKKQLVRQNKKIAPKQWRVQKYVDRNWKTEEQGMLENSKSLADILKDNLKYLKTPWDGKVSAITDDPWKDAADKTNWNNPTIKAMVDAMQKGKSSYSIHGDDIGLDDILDQLDDALHTK